MNGKVRNLAVSRAAFWNKWDLECSFVCPLKWKQYCNLLHFFFLNKYWIPVTQKHTFTTSCTLERLWGCFASSLAEVASGLLAPGWPLRESGWTQRVDDRGAMWQQHCICKQNAVAGRNTRPRQSSVVVPSPYSRWPYQKCMSSSRFIFSFLFFFGHPLNLT